MTAKPVASVPLIGAFLIVSSYSNERLAAGLKDQPV